MVIDNVLVVEADGGNILFWTCAGCTHCDQSGTSSFVSLSERLAYHLKFTCQEKTVEIDIDRVQFTFDCKVALAFFLRGLGISGSVDQFVSTVDCSVGVALRYHPSA